MSEGIWNHGSGGWPCELCVSGMCQDEKCQGGRQCRAALCTPPLMPQKDYSDFAEGPPSELEALRERVRELEADNKLLHEAPLCGGHADAWYTSRPHIRPDGGCLWCDLEQERDETLAREAKLREVLGAIVQHLLDDDWVTATLIARHAGQEALARKGEAQ